MPNIATSQPFPNDAWKSHKDCSLIANSQSIRQINSMCPVDEMEEFQDPLSDLNLFLCKKVNEMMHKKGGIKNWNHQIEKDILQRILPEFKVKFPYYRLGIAALKRTWEKISYYQKKVIYREAYEIDGKLNINYLIKENIRSYQENYKQSSQCYYDQIPSLANNLCECVAILEGKQPNLQNLTRTIWAVQQHLLPPSILKSIPMQKETDGLDRFICQNMLYYIHQNPNLSYEKLKNLVRYNCLNLFQSDFFHSMEKLATIVSIILSKSYIGQAEFSKSTRTAIETYISNHIHWIYRGKSDSSITYLSFVQNMISVLSLIPSLPKNYELSKLRIAIRLIVQEKSRSFLSYFPNFDPVLYAFIKIESVLLKEQKKSSSKDQMEEEILRSYTELCNISIESVDNQNLEIILWESLDKARHISQSITPEILQSLLIAIQDSIIDQPKSTFAQQVRTTTYRLQEMQKCTVDRDNITERIEYFCLQNEMACRFIPIEKQHYLWDFLQRSVGKGLYKKKKQIIKEVIKMSISLHPILPNYMDHLLFRIDTLYKHFWYQESCKTMNTLKAFIHRQSESITAHPCEKKRILRERLTRLLPVTPFSDEEL
ncbi:MAG: hypothetical protein ACRCSV_01865 [Chlamydiales bacterium]